MPEHRLEFVPSQEHSHLLRAFRTASLLEVLNAMGRPSHLAD